MCCRRELTDEEKETMKDLVAVMMDEMKFFALYYVGKSLCFTKYMYYSAMKGHAIYYVGN